MVVDKGIDDMYVGDVDGNGFDDVMLALADNTLRVYHNFDGVIDVDGYPVCLDIYQ